MVYGGRELRPEHYVLDVFFGHLKKNDSYISTIAPPLFYATSTPDFFRDIYNICYFLDKHHQSAPHFLAL